MILAIAVVAAVATPTPDPVTMLVAMAPLVVLWELSVGFARIVERRAERAADRAEEDGPDDDEIGHLGSTTTFPYPEAACCSTSAAAADAAPSR